MVNSIEFLASMLRSIAGTEISERRIQAILEEKAQLDSGGVDDLEALHQQALILSNLWEHLDTSSAPWLLEVRHLHLQDEQDQRLKFYYAGDGQSN